MSSSTNRQRNGKPDDIPVLESPGGRDGKPLIKVVTLLKRKKGMSRAEFREHYESHHAKRFDQWLALPGIVRYCRRYVTPIPDGISGEVNDTGYDSLTEVWLDDPDLYRSWTSGAVMGPEARAAIAEEEEVFLDRDSVAVCVVEEVDSTLPK